MKGTHGLMLAAAMIFTSALAAQPRAKATAPTEISSAAPAGTSLLGFASSGDGADADAVAVYESTPDKEDIRHRTLIVFEKKSGRFVPAFSNDRLIACSKCSQFHDDPFDIDYVEVTPGHIHIDQFDSGEKPSTTVLDLVREAGGWGVENAVRISVIAGRGAENTEKLALPASGLASDMDAGWTVPIFFNTLLVNRRSGEFMFLHGSPTPESIWDRVRADCHKSDCTVLIQQQDGCISLVRDAAGRSFGGSGVDPKNEGLAVSRAVAACEASHGQDCKEVRTDCSKGV